MHLDVGRDDAFSTTPIADAVFARHPELHGRLDVRPAQELESGAEIARGALGLVESPGALRKRPSVVGAQTHHSLS